VGSPSAELVTGRLGLGAIVLLAGFLVVDGQQLGAYRIVETYGSSTAWGVVVAVPTLVLSYILGVLCVGTAEITVGRMSALGHGREVDALLSAATAGNLVQATYSDLVRRRELLEGAIVAFALLAIGCVADLPMMPGQPALVFVLAAISLVLAVLCFLFAVRAARRIDQLTNALG
jgi:uncharacterized membrane protein (DUF485 family)